MRFGRHQQRHKLFIVLCLFFFLGTFMARPAYGEEQLVGESFTPKHVLLINAYHQGFTWTDDQTAAIMEKFTSDDYILHIEYLDWKRYPDEVSLEHLQSAFQYKYHNIPISVILTTDDKGLEFAIDNRGLLKDAPIVYTGIFEETAIGLTKGVERITGVYEWLDVQGTFDLMKSMIPRLDHVYVLTDVTESGQATKPLMISVLEAEPAITYEFLDSLSYEEIMKKLSEEDENAAIIMGTYNQDAYGEKRPNELFCEVLSDVSPIPIFSPYEYLMGHGIVGGSMISGTLQGREGANLALAILAGVEPDSMANVQAETVILALDYEVLKEHNYPVRGYASEVEILNKPVTMYSQYKETILIGLSVIILLTLGLVILSVNIRLRKQAQGALHEKHLALSDAYESLAASEEELRAQNEELMEHQEKIHFLAYNDHLTALPNRLQIKKEAHQMMAMAEKNKSQVLLLFVDLDNFNYINTAYGHMIGDMMLTRIGNDLQNYLGDKGSIGRIGGDEFVCVIPVVNEFPCEQYVTNLMARLNRQVTLGGHEIYSTASVGYAIYPIDGLTYDDLLIRADMAMYKAKSQGKAMAKQFDEMMNKEMIHKITTTNALKGALDRGEMYVVYQPQYDFEKEEVVGYEALIRWKHHELGLIPPNIFIPIAESSGDIIEIGYFVLYEACIFLKALEARSEQKRISINLSTLQLLQSDFAMQVGQMFKESQVDPSWFEFEITESVLIESFDVVNRQLYAIRELGVTIGLDDFGTGYSSLTYLKRLPIHTLKIDKTFIDDILIEKDQHFFTRAIIDIGKELGFRIIAEGVEKDEQIDYLRACDSPIIQGYWYSKPQEMQVLLGEMDNYYQ